MKEHGMYFATKDFYNVIRSNGGVWNDAKERPLVCLVKSTENSDVFWAIPVGNWNHRTQDAQNRIKKYRGYDEADIRSCFYHLGNTDVKSIFFISDVVPITAKYINKEYLSVFTNKLYEIKNKVLLLELKRKVSRILAWEKVHPNYFRQHITDVKEYLIEELTSKTN